MSEQELKIIEKIKKLLALGSSPNESEAQAAILKAHELLLDYNLSLSDIKEEISITEHIYEKSNKVVQYKRTVVSWVCKLNFCSVLYYIGYHGSYVERRVKTYTQKIVGKPHNVIVCINMIDYIIDSIERLAKLKAGYGREYISSYKKGLADNLALRIEAMCESDIQDNSGSKELVINNQAEIDEYFKSKGVGKLKFQSSSVVVGAYNKGKEDGDSIRLNKQVVGSKSQVLQIGG